MKRLKFEERVVQPRKGEKEFTYYAVFNKKTKEQLGLITKEHWKRWTWEVMDNQIIMSRGCLQEVVSFMKELGGKE